MIDDRCFPGETAICTNSNCTNYKKKVKYHGGIQMCVCDVCSTYYMSKQAKARVSKQMFKEARKLAKEARE